MADVENINSFKFDLEILDRYVKFSSEIVRLSLLTPAVVAFIATLTGKDPNLKSIIEIFKPHSSILFAAASSLICAIALGLSHQFWATDSMQTYLEIQRKKIRPTPEDVTALQEQMEATFERCGYLLIGGSGFLVIGAGSLIYLTVLILIGP